MSEEEKEETIEEYWQRYNKFWRERAEKEGIDLNPYTDYAEKTVRGEAISAAEKLKQKTGDDFWKEFYSYRASNVHEKPVNPQGAIILGGGSKSGKRHRKPKKTIAEYLKTWGT